MVLRLVCCGCVLGIAACGFDFGLLGVLIALGMRLWVCLGVCYLAVACCVCGWLHVFFGVIC